MVGKRKAEEAKSMNINTRRVEKRRKEMTDHERTVDNAKRADNGAIVYAVRKLKQSAAFKAANEATQEIQLQNCKDAVIIKRYAD
jgi:hypothetical protein